MFASPRSQDSEKLGGGVGTRLRTHLICVWRDGYHGIGQVSEIWCVIRVIYLERSYASLMRSVSYFMRLVIYFMRTVSYSMKLVTKWLLTAFMGCSRLGHNGQYNNPLTFHPYSQL